jgi:hypothetical protein
LYKIGGGNQSQKEFQMALDKNIPCFEVGIWIKMGGRPPFLVI